MRLVLAVPPANVRGPQYMDQAFAAIHQANPERLPFELQIGRHAGRAVLTCRCPEELHAAILGQFYAAYPDARLERLSEREETTAAGRQTWEAELHLENELFPIKRYPQFEDALNRVSADPLTALLLPLAVPARDSVEGRIVIEARPAHGRKRHRAEKCLRRLASPLFRRHHRLAHAYARLALSPRLAVRFAGWLLGRLGRDPEHHAAGLTTSPARQHDREEDLQAAADKISKHLFEVQIHLIVTARRGASGPGRGQASRDGRCLRPVQRPAAGAFPHCPAR